MARPHEPRWRAHTAAGQCRDLGDDRFEDGDKSEHRLAACGALEVVGQAGRLATETLEELGSGATSTVATLREERRETLLAEARGAPRRRVALEERERDGRVHVGEDGASAGPEAVEQCAQPVREREALVDQVIARPYQSARAWSRRTAEETPEAMSSVRRTSAS